MHNNYIANKDTRTMHNNYNANKDTRTHAMKEHNYQNTTKACFTLEVRANKTWGQL